MFRLLARAKAASAARKSWSLAQNEYSILSFISSSGADVAAAGGVFVTGGSWGEVLVAAGGGAATTAGA
jgi:hypothetical protein